MTNNTKSRRKFLQCPYISFFSFLFLFLFIFLFFFFPFLFLFPSPLLFFSPPLSLSDRHLFPSLSLGRRPGHHPRPHLRSSALHLRPRTPTSHRRTPLMLCPAHRRDLHQRIRHVSPPPVLHSPSIRPKTAAVVSANASGASRRHRCSTR